MFRTVAMAALMLTGSSLASAQATGQRVKVNGMQMYYEVSGSGDPLIVLHGAYMNIPTMGAIIPKLAKTQRSTRSNFRVTAAPRTSTGPSPIRTWRTTWRRSWTPWASQGGRVRLLDGCHGRTAARHPPSRRRSTSSPRRPVAYDVEGWQPEFKAVIPQMNVEMIVQMPFAEDYKKLAPNPKGFPELAQEAHRAREGADGVGRRREGGEAPVLVITGDADVATLEHSVAMFRLLGGGAMGDMGKPLSAARLAVLPATSHTAVITQPELLHAFIEPFLKGDTPKGMFEASGTRD